jgi:ribosomal protein S18 acetylase RimI-like enzyme
MTNTIEVIPINFDDPAHCSALVELMDEYIAHKMGDGIPYTEDQKEMLVNGLRDHPSRLILLAKSGERFIGLVTSFINFATFTVKPFVNIHDVIVTDEWRNKGIGRIMLSDLIIRAEKMGCSKVTLEVREDNDNARHLYNSLGFHDAEPRQYYWAKYL